jgi:mRNA-degrading endonuclease toxin of MazEF toxin-antitoxin module
MTSNRWQAELGLGRIVWVIVRDPQGYRKRRPAIVLTPAEEISSELPLTVMAITTTFADPPPRNCVALPWNSDPRRVSTGLARRSAAVTNWLDTVYPDEVDGVIGTTPPKTLAEIQRRLADLERETK